MDIKLKFTEKCDYIPNGTEYYRNVINFNCDWKSVTFEADCFTNPISKKFYSFLREEVEYFKMGNYSIIWDETAMEKFYKKEK